MFRRRRDGRTIIDRRRHFSPFRNAVTTRICLRDGARVTEWDGWRRVTGRETERGAFGFLISLVPFVSPSSGTFRVRQRRVKRSFLITQYPLFGRLAACPFGVVDFHRYGFQLADGHSKSPRTVCIRDRCSVSAIS